MKDNVEYDVQAHIAALESKIKRLEATRSERPPKVKMSKNDPRRSRYSKWIDPRITWASHEAAVKKKKKKLMKKLAKLRAWNTMNFRIIALETALERKSKAA